MVALHQLTDQHIQAISQALGGTVTEVTPISDGHSGSTFKATLLHQVRSKDNVELQHDPIVVSVFSRSEDNLYGIDADAQTYIPHLQAHAADELIYIKDQKGRPLRDIAILKPYAWNIGKPNQNLCGQLEFPTTEYFKPVHRTVMVTPYIDGVVPRNIPMTPEICYRAGRALAAYHRAATKFDDKGKLKDINGLTAKKAAFGTLQHDDTAIDKLADRLWKENGFASHGTENAREEADTLVKKIGDALDETYPSWSKLIDTSPKGMAHNDFTPRNAIFSKGTGKLIAIDFGEACRAPLDFDMAVGAYNWSTPSYQPQQELLTAFIAGYDAVRPISKETWEHMNTHLSAAALRWAVMQFELIAKHDAEITPPKVTMEQFDHFKEMDTKSFQEQVKEFQDKYDQSLQTQIIHSDDYTRKIRTIENAVDFVAEYRKKHPQAKIGLTSGVYDMIHEGHSYFLAEASKRCDLLVIATPSDATVKKLKGETRPIRNEKERAGFLASLPNVGLVTITDDDDFAKLADQVKPDIFFAATEHNKAAIPALDKLGNCEIAHITSKNKAHLSTTNLIDRITASKAADNKPALS